MDDSFTDFLNADLATLPGVGPKLRPALARLIGGETVLDLLFHLPVNWIERKPRACFADAVAGEAATVSGMVDQVSGGRGGSPVRIRLRDETGFLTLVYFRANAQWIARTFQKGEIVAASGMVDERNGERQILHPDHVGPARSDSPMAAVEIEPVYRMSADITGRMLRKWAAAALDRMPAPAETVDRHFLEKQSWTGFLAALETLHRPLVYDPDAFARARSRLAYDEAMARELALLQARRARDSRPAPILPKALNIERTLIEALGFRPTRGQLDAFADISADLARPAPMRRMIQGDVGSGKTLVAALATAQAAAGGAFTAIMSPTEVLARQQAEAIGRFLKPVGFACEALTGRDRGRERKAILERVARGEVQALSGTQALYQGDVELPHVGLVIVDEQHRFGVADRMRLTAKGGSPHMLVMSATPIPRTLAQAFQGDLDVSVIRDKPKGRQPVTTRVASDARLDEVMDAVVRAVRRDERAYWICPTVDTEDDAGASVLQRQETLKALAGDVVELVHGRMPPAAKDQALENFRSGAARILVATTVVEVGVDVPDATIIVIERADKFGLAQLHQLRGRVGRGSRPSSCLLLYRAPLTDAGRERLDTLRNTNDGFEIAEADYRLRGPGDLLGLRQSGMPDFRVFDLELDSDLIAIARTDVRSLLNADPDLATPRGRTARMFRDLLAPRLSAMLSAPVEPRTPQS